MEKHSVLIPDLTGGLNLAAAEDMIADNECRDILNYDISEPGRLKKVGGYKRYLSETHTINAFKWLKVPTVVGSGEMLLYVKGLELWKEQNKIRTKINVLPHGYFPSPPTKMVTVDRFVFFNTPTPMKLFSYKEGHAVVDIVSKIGITKPPKPTVEVLSGGVLSGTYYYKVTFYNKATTFESSPSFSSDPVAVSGAMIKIDIPVCDEAGVDTHNIWRKIYRIGGVNAEWKLVATIENNHDTSYTDNIPDANLAIPLTSEGNDPPPPNIRQFVWLHNRCYALADTIVGDKNAPTGEFVFVSNFNEPEGWDYDDDLKVWKNMIKVSSKDFEGQRNTAIAAYENKIIVFKENSIWEILEDDSVRLLTSSVGCTIPDSIVAVENSLFWATSSGIWQLYSGTLKKISEKIQPLWDSISKTQAESAAGVYFNGHYHLNLQADVDTRHFTGYDWEVVRYLHPEELFIRGREYYAQHIYRYNIKDKTLTRWITDDIHNGAWGRVFFNKAYDRVYYRCPHDQIRIRDLDRNIVGRILPPLGYGFELWYGASKPRKNFIWPGFTHPHHGYPWKASRINLSTETFELFDAPAPHTYIVGCFQNRDVIVGVHGIWIYWMDESFNVLATQAAIHGGAWTMVEEVHPSDYNGFTYVYSYWGIYHWIFGRGIRQFNSGFTHYVDVNIGEIRKITIARDEDGDLCSYIIWRGEDQRWKIIKGKLFNNYFSGNIMDYTVVDLNVGDKAYFHSLIVDDNLKEIYITGYLGPRFEWHPTYENKGIIIVLDRDTLEEIKRIELDTCEVLFSAEPKPEVTVVKKRQRPFYSYATHIKTLVYNNALDRWTIYEYGGKKYDVRITEGKEILYFAIGNIIYEYDDKLNTFDGLPIKAYIYTKAFNFKSQHYKRFLETTIYGDKHIETMDAKIDFYCDGSRTLSRIIDVLYDYQPFKTMLTQDTIGTTISLYLEDNSSYPGFLSKLGIEYILLPPSYRRL